MGFEPHDLRVMRGSVKISDILSGLNTSKSIEIECLSLENYIAEPNVPISISLSWGQNGVTFFNYFCICIEMIAFYTF